MNDEELNRKISELSKKVLLEVNPIPDTKEIFSKFDSQKWENWLHDIIYHEFAFPISNLHPEGDILIDIIDYLKQCEIPLIQYEKAISKALTKEFYQSNSTLLLERLLNVEIAICGTSSTKTLVSILLSRTNAKQKGKSDYIKTLALLALTKSAFISTNNRLEIYNYLILQGLKEMQHDYYFYSASLKFVYSKISIDDFFVFLTIILILFDKKEFNKLESHFIPLIVDKIEELHYRKLPIFYSSLYKWVIKTQSDYEDILRNNKLYKTLIKNIGELFLEDYITIEDNHEVIQSNREVKLKELIELILSLQLESDINCMHNPDKLYSIIEYALEETEDEKIIKNLIVRHKSYVKITQLRIISNSMKIYTSKHKGFIKFLNDTLYNISNDSSGQAIANVKDSQKNIMTRVKQLDSEVC